MNKAGYVRCATCVITRGVSSIRVLFRALGRASTKTWILKGTPRSFFALTRRAYSNGANEIKMKRWLIDALAYASREEMTLQGMMDNVNKVGYGQPWTHIVTVNGGTSVAYTIKMEE